MSQSLLRSPRKASNDLKSNLNESIRKAAVWRLSIPDRGKRKGTARSKGHTYPGRRPTWRPVPRGTVSKKSGP